MKGVVCSILSALLSLPSLLSGVEIQGEITAEARLFADPPPYEGQRRNNGSLSIDTEVYQEINPNTTITIEGFYRYDSSDSERSHTDLRLCNLLYVADDWQLTLGFDKVFWGVTEFVHLVDIINQTDVLEGIDGEEKLGQPMINLSYEGDWGTIDGFLLPYFRKRSFPGEGGRLRGPVVINGSDAEFESSAEEYHQDLAVRYSHTLKNWDFGLYQFLGTSREPLYIEKSEEDGSLIPYYEQITQTGLDLQLTVEQWLWKLEAAYRSSENDNGFAAVFGFEYTLAGVAETPCDIGFIGEYIFDDRNIADTSLYDNDIMAGLRFSLNDQNSTEILTGLIWDTVNHSTALSLEMSRRISNSFKLEVSGILLNQLDGDDPAYIYHKDSFIRLIGIYYF